MLDRNTDDTSPLVSLRKIVVWGSILIALCSAIILVFLLLQPKTPLQTAIEKGVSVTAMNKRFVIIENSWQRTQGEYVLSAELVFIRSLFGRAVTFDEQLLHTLCEEVLTSISKEAAPPINPLNVLQMVWSFPVFENGKPTGELHFNQAVVFPIEGGACPSEF